MRNHFCKCLGVLLIGCSLSGVAQQESGFWRAANQSARSITGDIGFTGEKLTINFMGFTVAHIRALESSEILAAFSPENGVQGNGSLYRVAIPSATKFLHKNTLCGSDDVSWMVTYLSGRSLEVKFFSSQKPPVLTPEGLTDSADLCGTYSYVR